LGHAEKIPVLLRRRALLPIFIRV